MSSKNLTYPNFIKPTRYGRILNVANEGAGHFWQNTNLAVLLRAAIIGPTRTLASNLFVPRAEALRRGLDVATAAAWEQEQNSLTALANEGLPEPHDVSVVLAIDPRHYAASAVSTCTYDGTDHSICSSVPDYYYQGGQEYYAREAVPLRLIDERTQDALGTLLEHWGVGAVDLSVLNTEYTSKYVPPPRRAMPPGYGLQPPVTYSV